MKIKEFIKENKVKLLATASSVIALAPVNAFAAEESSIATTISTSMQQVVTDTISTMGAVAPIGITIFGAMFCWKKGKKILTTITG